MSNVRCERWSRSWTLILMILLVLSSTGAALAQPFRIEVVDEETGRGVPLVELKTVNQIRYMTDSNGIVAFDEPGLLGLRVFFEIKSHGYEAAKDGFGIRGVGLDTKPGGSARVKIHRINLAKRLYRITGAGIYRDSVLTGTPVPTAEPVLNGQVLGQDSVLNAVYRGKIHWFWGDTNRPGYPLGNFHSPGAVSDLPGQGGLDPSRGVDLRYFLDEKTGFAKGTCEMPGSGPTWITGLVVLKDQDGVEQLYANYAKIKPPLETYQRGLVRFNPETSAFEKVAEFPGDLMEKGGEYPGGHPFLKREGDVDYIYYCSPFPLMRIPAEASALSDPDKWEVFTCLKPGVGGKDAPIDRKPDGSLNYGWKTHARLLTQERQDKLIADGQLKQEETLLNVRDVLTGKRVLVHGTSVYWNAYRNRWVMVLLELYGSSMLGEVWYAEADAPLGPWVYARKVVTHDNYSFYNPKHHPMFDQEGGRVIHFEGTYTASFTANKDFTPRYEYNQVMYQLDLADSQLALPVAVYAKTRGDGPAELAVGRKPGDGGPAGLRVEFFAPDRPGIATVPVVEDRDAEGRQRLSALPGGADRATEPGKAPLFHVVPHDAPKPFEGMRALHEFESDTGNDRYYSTTEEPRPGYRRNPKALGWVWPNPGSATVRE